MKKKIFAVFLALTLIVTMMPAAIAEGDEEPIDTSEEQTLLDTDPNDDESNAELDTLEDEQSEDEPEESEPENEQSDEAVPHETETGESEAETETETATENSYGEIVEEEDSGSGSSLTPAVNFTNAAPLVTNTNTTTSSGRRKAQSRVASTANKSNTSTEGIETSKTATYDENTKDVTIRLESYVTGKTVTTTTYTPTDIVLVLDQSGSMAYDLVTEDTELVKFEGDNARAYETDGNLYYLAEDGKYHQVEVTRDGSNDDATYTYKRVDGNGIKNPTGGPFSDLSKYMCENKTGIPKVTFYTYPSEPRLTALQKAAKDFVDMVYKDAQEYEVDHTISVVGFAGNVDESYKNTGVFVGKTLYKYDDGAADQYENAIQHMYTDEKANETGYKNVMDSIDALGANGATSTDLGLVMAQGILGEISNTETRNKVVIVFTDGVPTTATGFDNTVANDALTTANTMKSENSNVTIYTIGIFSGADPSQKIDVNTTDETQKANQFMNYLSSNYSNAASMDSTDCTKNENIQDGDSGYYLTANNSGKLNEIFDNIYREITNTSTNMSVSHELGEDTVVKDVISKYFAGTDEDSVNVYTAEYNGKDSDGKDQWGEYEELEGASVTVSEDGKTVSVSGFDFSENYVGTVDEVVIGETKSSNPHGKKLVIEFTVKPEADFWGGNGVPTNEETSGVYKDEDETTPLTPFDVPTVDVPLNIPTPTAKDVYVYYNGSTPIASDLASVTIPSGNDAWKVAFVDPVLSISSGTVSNTENDTYKVTLTVTPKNKDKDGNKTSASTSCDANVTILVPKVTFTDSTIYLSQQVESFLPSSVSWVKLGADGKATENSAEAASTIIGTAPTLSYTYSTLPGAFTDCTTVTPTVSCGTAVCAAAVANDFTVHVLKPTITFKDSTVYYGDVYTDTNYAQNLVSTTWADANENHTATATSTAPDIVYTYATNPTTYLTGGLINTPNDITVTVTATAGNTDVSSYVAHQDCTGKTSEVTSSNQFIVHVKTCTLTIKNNVTGTSGDDTAFLFKVSGGAFELKDLPVVVTGDSVKITGLPVGTYTVTADDGWSWRYNVTSNSENTSMSSAKPDGVVTFTNTLKNPYWLSGSDRAVNVWSKDGDKEKVVRQSTTTTTTTN